LLGGGPNATKTAAELFQMALPQEITLDYYAIEEPWTLQHNPYTVAPEGSPVDVAKEVMDMLRQNNP
jgi:alpha-N-acetylglucosaminidase